MRARRALRDIPWLDEPDSLVLTQNECLCILANAFLCTFTGRPSHNCASGRDAPSINFDEMYGGSGGGSVKVAKLLMLFEYFERCRARRLAGELLARPIRITRRRAEASTRDDWQGCEAPLLPCIVRARKESIHQGRGMLEVDFANRLIGGAALAFGCAQEEILFCVRPELIVTRLCCPAMRDEEAIVVVGTESFSTHRGYGLGLEFRGSHSDSAPLTADGVLRSYVVAIDAYDFRATPTTRQYEADLILRELTKAWAGFGGAEPTHEVATGNWGCGEFRGDVELKSVLQWLAASRAGRVMHYFPWNDTRILDGLPNLSSALAGRHATVGEIAAFLLHDLEPGDVFVQLARRFAM